MQQHAGNNEFAILYRTNSQSRALEEALRRSNIKYRIVGGLSFYQRKEIKDLIAYIRFVLNQDDETALRRIINLPKRGIGPGTVEKIFVEADEQGLSIWEIIQNGQAFIGGKGGAQVQGFADLIKGFRLAVEKKDAYEAALLIAKNSGLLKELYDDKTVEGLSRYENVQELLNAIKEFSDDQEREDKGLNAFLQDVALLTDEDRNKENAGDAVTLMTIHSAKGLEFPYVFIVGMEEELFPSQMMLNSRADLEEERRLFYVAITRAKKRLHLTYALNRYRFGRLKNCEPSRFLEEVDPAFLKVNRKYSSPETVSPSGSYFAKNFVKTQKEAAQTKKFTAAPAHTPSDDFKPSDTTNLAAGMKVEHPKFGFGEVVAMDMSGSNRKATVNFKNVGEKTLLLAFAKLRILE